MKPLDNLCHPVSVIREAEELAADAFGAAHAFLMEMCIRDRLYSASDLVRRLRRMK